MRLLALYLILLNTAFVLASDNHDSVTRNDTIPLYSRTNHQAFQTGEELNYSLSYGFLNGGKAQLLVQDNYLNNSRVQHIIGRGETTGLTDKLFRVRDRYESFVNPKDGLPLKAVRSIREGKYEYYNEVFYDRDSCKVVSNKSGEHAVQPDMLDILSALYFARNHNLNNSLEQGEIIEFMTYFSDKPYPLRIKYRGNEIIKTSFGKVECYVFSPVTEVGRVFDTEDDVKVWITKDGNRVPIKIEMNIAVGSFVCKLESYKGLKHPFSSVK